MLSVEQGGSSSGLHCLTPRLACRARCWKPRPGSWAAFCPHWELREPMGARKDCSIGVASCYGTQAFFFFFSASLRCG